MDQCIKCGGRLKKTSCYEEDKDGKKRHKICGGYFIGRPDEPQGPVNDNPDVEGEPGPDAGGSSGASSGGDGGGSAGGGTGGGGV